jgi:tetratricopeptide (TPR) repeat protein
MLDNFDDLLSLAHDAHERKKYHDEIDFLKKALQSTTSKKDIASIYDKIGSSLYLLHKNKEAKQNLYFAIENLSGLSEDKTRELLRSINYKLGSIFFAEEDYQEALNYNLKAFQHIEHPYSENAFMVLTAIGVSYDNLNNYDKAINFYYKAMEVSGITDEDKAMLLQFLGQCYDKKGDDRKAFEYYHNLFSIDPNYDSDWYVMYRFAQLSYRFKRYGNSIDYFNKAITEIPLDQKNYLQHSHQLLGYNFLAKKEFKYALVELKAALKIKTDSSKRKSYIYCGMAQGYFGLNKINKAIKFGLKSLNEEYDEEVAEKMYFLLAFCYGMYGTTKNKEKEKLYTEKLKNLFPTSAYLRELKRF